MARNQNQFTIGSRKPRQDWNIGETVNVGFLKGLMVVSTFPTPGDVNRASYKLVAKNGTHYVFTPNGGIGRADMFV